MARATPARSVGDDAVGVLSLWRRVLVSLLPALCILLAGASGVLARQWLVPPVDAPIGRHFEPPASAFGRGHRGLDYSAPAGSLVRSAGSGSVTFAGNVGGSGAIAIDHGGGMQSTYSRLGSILVTRGEQVDAGQWIGRTADAHAGTPGLHFGVKVDGGYVDPRPYLGQLDAAGAISLVPVETTTTEGSSDGCTPQRAIGDTPKSPNDNIAVAIAGIGSKTLNGTVADMYEHGPEELGYPPARTYRFSYRGSDDVDLHEDYDRLDTYAPLQQAAEELRDLLERVARRHPGDDVDLIAHSQGGVVGRAFLELVAEEWDPDLPRIEHLVTFAAPHTGAPLAATVDDLRETASGPLLLRGASWWANNGGLLPDPYSGAVRDLAPGSDLMRRLAAEDVLYGTRVLSLATPNDVVVPADRALYPGKLGRVVAPEGINGHSRIVASQVAQGIARSFLRGAAPPCSTGWDRWGPQVGRVVGFAESKLGWVYEQLERRTVGPLLRVAQRTAHAAADVGRLVYSGVAGSWERP